MVDFVTLTCPNCGGKLEITNDIDRFACAHCGTEHIVRRSGGVVTLNPVVDGLKEVKKGVDKTASELAIKRLEEEIVRLDSELRSLSGHPGKIFGIGLALSIGIPICGWCGSIVQDVPATGPLVLGLIIFVITIVAFVIENSDTNKKIQKIEDEISGKYIELERHKAIVRME